MNVIVVAKPAKKKQLNVQVVKKEFVFSRIINAMNAVMVIARQKKIIVNAHLASQDFF
jgi:hypothetical protein